MSFDGGSTIAVAVATSGSRHTSLLFGESFESGFEGEGSFEDEAWMGGSTKFSGFEACDDAIDEDSWRGLCECRRESHGER